MKLPIVLAGLAASALLGAAAHAQSTAPVDASQQVLQRQVNQQQRVEKGLKDGSLSVKEAGRIERGEAALDRAVARDARNGISPTEQRRLNRRENALSKEIAADRVNARRGNPESTSNERLQADVQRNSNQQQRILNGVKDGQLSNAQTANLERGQSLVDRKEARAAANSHVGNGEQASIQRSENHQSRRIHQARSNG